MTQCIVHDTNEQQTRPLASTALLTQAARAAGDAELEAALACAALELVAAVSEAATPGAAAVALANRLQAFLEADGVALATANGGGRYRLAAVAGTADVNRGSQLSTALEQALNETAGDRDVSARERLSPMLPRAAIETCRLSTKSGTIAGALLVWSSNAEFDASYTQRFLRLAGEPLAAAFRLSERARPGILGRTAQRAFSTRRWFVWAGAAAIGLGTLLLMPYRIACDCAAEPLTRRFSAAPFAGVFEKSLVRPGDVVTKSELLGRMDGRELRIELAAVTADYERTRKSHDVNLAAGKVAAAQIDRLELERLDQQRKLLEHRTANLEIRSPVAGYVIGGDLKRSEGAPLSVGQILYEIAPLDQMIVEVAIADDDIAEVETGQAVTIRFDAYAGEAFAGRLARIHPRSETRDGRNVFIGEVVLDNAASALRPGMKGKARIVIEGENLAAGLWKRSRHAVVTFLGL